jgi:hypothetical protein
MQALFFVGAIQCVQPLSSMSPALCPRPPAHCGVMTMKRFLFALVASVLALACATQAGAQRNFPEQAKRGDMKAYEYPSMKIDDKTFRLSPGSRIFNENNLIIMPASLQIQAAPVMYMLDTRGDLSSIWLLTRDEAARIAPPQPPQPPPRPQK